MKAQLFISLLVFLGFSNITKAQDSIPLKLHPFNSEKFNEEFQKHQLRDSLQVMVDTTSINADDLYSMRIYKVPQAQMAPMPNMSIRDDVNYSLKIKEYDSIRSKEPPTLKYHQLPNKGDSQSNPSGKKEKN